MAIVKGNNYLYFGGDDSDDGDDCYDGENAGDGYDARDDGGDDGGDGEDAGDDDGDIMVVMARMVEMVDDQSTLFCSFLLACKLRT